jgi:nuclear transport factor 2 (NTF2) superfamily protein
MQPSRFEEEPIRYPVPPFTEETAKQKVKAAQVGRNASRVYILRV